MCCLANTRNSTSRKATYQNSAAQRYSYLTQSPHRLFGINAKLGVSAFRNRVSFFDSFSRTHNRYLSSCFYCLCNPNQSIWNTSLSGITTGVLSGLYSIISDIKFHHLRLTGWFGTSATVLSSVSL